MKKPYLISLSYYCSRQQYVWISLLYLLVGCEKTDMLDVQFITISIENNIALESGGPIHIEAEVKDGAQNVLQDVPLEFYANEVLLEGNVFVPTTRGEYILKAVYKDKESNALSFRVVNLEKDLEGLALIYEGHQFLTTNEWSVSGNFSFEAIIENERYTLDPAIVDLYVDGAKVDQLGHFYFDAAGTYIFTAKVNTVESNEISIEVREKKTYEEVVIPVIFHNYGLELTTAQINQLMDTLNSSFSASRYSQEMVIQGLVNPNAVNCYIRFEKASTPPSGKTLVEPGLRIVDMPNNEYPTLSFDSFKEIEEAQMWDPTIYINIWLASGYDFSFPPINPSDQLGSGSARGLANSPYLADGALIGLPKVGNPKFPDPAELSHSILLNAGSVLGEHRDFLVNRMGYFLGLFDTFTFGCQSKGDYCDDTFSRDFNKETGPLNEIPSCKGPFFLFNNHMAVGRNKTCFTYDQRERMRYVLEHGMYRPR